MEEKKRGRPTNNPKGKAISVRLDEKTENILNEYANQEKIAKTEAIRRGVRKLESEIKK